MYPVLEEERAFEHDEQRAERGAAVVDAEQPLPRRPEADLTGKG